MSEWTPWLVDGSGGIRNYSEAIPEPGSTKPWHSMPVTRLNPLSEDRDGMNRRRAQLKAKSPRDSPSRIALPSGMAHMARKVTSEGIKNDCSRDFTTQTRSGGSLRERDRADHRRSRLNVVSQRLKPRESPQRIALLDGCRQGPGSSGKEEVQGRVKRRRNSNTMRGGRPRDPRTRRTEGGAIE